MDNNEIELVGAPCGYHGPYTFYKAFKYTKNGIVRILSLSEFFFVKLWCDSDLVCIGELQLLWLDKNSEQMLASLRLYFLPEHTPDGRLDHGEDEVLAISEKVVLRVEDLLTWITLDTEWNWGMSSTWSRDVSSPVPAAVKSEDDDDQDPLEQDPLALHSDVKDPLADCKDPLSADAKPFICTRRSAPALTDSLLDFSDVEKERNLLDDSWTKGVGVMVLSYPRYCRYRALMKRLEDVEDKWLKNSLVAALGGFTSPCKNTKVLFCKDTFDYPDLEGHELLCNHLAPKLKGRPRGKRKKRSISPGGSESNESESSVTIGTSANGRTRLTSTGGRNGLRCNTTTSPRRSTRCVQSTEEKDFLSKLNSFMKSHRTAIGRVPSLGFKEIDLYQFYSKVQKLGGYDKVTSNRMWKVIYDELGGNQNSTSAATITRRHYERLLLSYERKVKGEEHKPLPILERRRQKSKSASNNDVEIIESKPSTSGERVTPLRQNNDVTVPPIIPTNKVFTIPEKKSDGKTSSLRSVRVKPDRMRESLKQDKLISTSNNVSSTSSTLVQPISTSPTTVTSAIVTPITPPVPLPTSMASVLPAPTAPISIPTNVSPKDPPSLAADKPSMENVSVPVQPQTLPDEKENTPEVTNKENMSQEANKTVIEDDDDDEPIEVPYKPKTPEIIDLEDDSQPSPITITPVPEVKKRRLDILKEGGLEVTAIASALEITPITKDPRPSVIHQFNNPPETPKQLGRVSITVSPSVNKMLPPTTMKPISSTPKHLPPPDSISQYRRNMSNPPKSPYVPQNPSSSLRNPFNNGQIPPQVIQSRSIYSHSEKVVYGNPKVDLQIPAPQLNSHISQLIPSAHKPSGGEVLDLTVKSPQKPIVEIMRIPSVPLPTAAAASSQSSSSSYKEPVQKSNNKYSGYNFPPMIDGRVVGSNLEITIVGNPKSSHKSSTIPPSPQKLQIPPTTNHKLSSSSSSSHKRSSNGKFVPNKMGSTSGRLENGKHHMNHLNISTSLSRSNHRNGSSTSSNSANLVIPTPPPHHSSSSSSNRVSKSDESSSSRHKKQMTQQATSPSSLFPASLYPNYLPQLSAAAAASASKHPFLPMLDSSLYYTAAIAQGLYPPNPMHMAATLPLFPQTPTAEQLQLYKELIAHTSGLRLPFPPVLQESSASITSVGQTSNNSKN